MLHPAVCPLFCPAVLHPTACPLICRYGAGASLSRHSDNPHNENNRWLTAVYYTNEAWSETDGGCLRLYKPDLEDVSVKDSITSEALADDAIVDVAPLNDRLVLFFSDLRTPHEVLQVKAPRFATTLWYTEGPQSSNSLD